MNEQVEVKATSVAGIMQMFGVSRSTVERAIAEKELAAFRRGRRVFIFIADAEKWIRGEA